MTSGTFGVNGRTYAKPRRPVVVICVGGSEPDDHIEASTPRPPRSGSGTRPARSSGATVLSAAARLIGERSGEFAAATIREQSIAVPIPPGATSAHVRYHYTGDNDSFWVIDRFRLHAE
ncbi:hypothetical protein ACFYWO_23560 [Streptomyces sp. NPDC002932]|uniref:hypothetical protein n=1 Tax=Streptomyces sp. NPDC002932 TaxID=3364672 RepID=UPI0036B5A8E0